MACMNIEVDTTGFSESEVVDILDHLFQHHEKDVLKWIKDQVDDYVCVDCPGRSRRDG